MAAPNRWIEGDFVSFGQPLGDFDPVRGAQAHLNLPAFKMILTRHEANIAVMFGDNGLVGDCQHVLAMRHGDINLCGHAWFQPLAAFVELEDSSEVPNILASSILLEWYLVYRDHLAFDYEVGQCFKLNFCPHAREDSIDDRFVQCQLNFHLRQIRQIK